MTDHSTSEPYRSLNEERQWDLGGCSWEDYILYVLEVEQSDVNTDGLGELSDALRSVDTGSDRS